ncbi:MAG: MBL fold metallo-hydrolase [Anaerolineae bacterium]|nr:MBL fold metallo-hydrolase [Anaerolineae bacterium]MCI0609652.1 MBL fold metallo-hydrolase [Anaerolineae bacterium]
MHIQLIRNATLRITYGNRIFITDPYLAPKHSQEPLIGKSRNPTVDLPFPSKDVLADIEMVLVSHLHPDHFDHLAQQQLPRNIQIYCQPGDEHQIKDAGFSNVVGINSSVEWHGVKITRTPGQHGDKDWAAQMGSVSGFIFRAEHEPTIYWTGDTIWCEAVEQTILKTKPDIIITHSSGASFEAGAPIIMDGRQTIQVCRAAPQSIVIAVHMETFDFDTTSRKDLRALAEAEGVEASQLLIPADGETFVF